MTGALIEVTMLRVSKGLSAVPADGGSGTAVEASSLSGSGVFARPANHRLTSA